MTAARLVDMLSQLIFEHPWLADEFVAESMRLGEEERGKEHHYVPQMYLKRWSVHGCVQPVHVDRRQPLVPQPPKDVAKKTNLYTLPAPDGTLDRPLRWIEKHLSRIEGECAHRLDEVERWGSGVISNDGLRRDLSVFLALQVTRTLANRERHLLLIKGPVRAKREFYRKMMPGLSDADFQAMLDNTYPDPKMEAIRLMFADVRNGGAKSLYQREWAVYRTATPIVTCDDPVVLVAGPPYDRGEVAGLTVSAAVLYPLNPNQVLVMLRPGLRHSGRYRLDQEETRSVNLEIVSAAASMVFERPGDDIAAHLGVPVRALRAELDDEQVAQLDDGTALRLLLESASPRSRWAGVAHAPGWPVPRWYTS